MNKIKYILPAFALLLFSGCSDDDGFYNTKYVQATNLVQIDNPSATYSVGDVVLVDAFVPRLLAEQDQTTSLDVRETTGNAPTFDFSYVLEKKNATTGEYEIYDVNGNYVNGATGHANLGYFVQGFLEYNTAAEEYRYQGGVQLTEAGIYRLNFSNTTINNNKVAMRSDSVNNNITLNIFSTSASLDGSGFFNFTVN